MNYKKQIELERAGKDKFMKTAHQSPLHHEPRLLQQFQNLDYYPINENWKFEIELQRHEKVETFEMELSTGGLDTYKRVGFFEFKHPDNGELVKIQGYESDNGHLSIMYRDKTSGEETYGAGRYLEIEEHHGKYVLDFNLSYNPFCAYSEAYTCPLPPFENWLQVEVTAGEKDFTLTH